MATLKQIESNRRNAQKSTGPRTLEGKLASKFNALKHGIDAKSQVVFEESAEDLAHLTAEYYEQYEPSNPTERILVDTLINTDWRLRRLRIVEAEVWEAESDTLLRRRKIHNPKAYVTGGETFVFGVKSFLHVQRVITACERAFHRALKELQRLKAEAKPQPSAEAEPPSQQPPEKATQPEPIKRTSEKLASISKIEKDAAPPHTSGDAVRPCRSILEADRCAGGAMPPCQGPSVEEHPSPCDSLVSL